MIRPSELVTDVKAGLLELVLDGVGEDRHVKVVITCAAGRPVVVSRTWHVMGSRVAILEEMVGANWEDSAWSLDVEEVGIN